MDMAFWSTVTVASFLGSLHCVGMCGPLAAYAAGGAGAVGRGGADASSKGNCASGGCHRPRGTVVSYQAGRLASYLLIGAIAGTLGAALDLGGDLLGWQRAAAWAAGIGLIAAGVMTLARSIGIRLPHFPVPQRLGKWINSVRKLSASWGPRRRAAALGAVTGLLPCGWLYSFVIIAAGTGSPIAGTAVMGLLWLGAVPALVSVAWSASWLVGRMRRHATWAMAVLVIVVGVTAVRSRTGAAFEPWLKSLGSPTAATAEKLQRLTSELPPCCQEREAKLAAEASANETQAATDATVDSSKPDDSQETER